VSQFFPHEKLDVYQHALKFSQLATDLIDSWPASLAVRNQFDRAMESVLTNIAIAVRHQRTDRGIYQLESSLGSVLECATCLDVAQCRCLIDDEEIVEAKMGLQEIARMEVKLRSSWEDGPCIHEGEEPYAANSPQFFNHEKLDVYQISLQVHRTLYPIFSDKKLTHRHARRIDGLSTSLTLNIAEGNGRFSKRDHSEFLKIAEESGVKLAAYLDLFSLTETFDLAEVKALLLRVMAMLSRLKEYLRSEG
jgi:four helix bundle protein